MPQKPVGSPSDGQQQTYNCQLLPTQFLIYQQKWIFACKTQVYVNMSWATKLLTSMLITNLYTYLLMGSWLLLEVVSWLHWNHLTDRHHTDSYVSILFHQPVNAHWFHSWTVNSHYPTSDSYESTNGSPTTAKHSPFLTVWLWSNTKPETFNLGQLSFQQPFTRLPGIFCYRYYRCSPG